MKTIGVVLAGCGHLDGSEIREAVCTLVSLDRYTNGKDIQLQIMAPNRDQYHVLNHLTRQETKEKRNMLVEAARIARGQIKDMATINPNTLDALVLPGGFGAAKNLCSYAFKGAMAEVDDQLARLITHIYEQKKPIGAVCIAPAIVALVLGKRGIEVTLGEDEGAITEVQKTGALHFKTKPGEIHVDLKHKIVTTPAYMHGDAPLFKVADGIDQCMKKVVELLNY